MLAVKEAAAPDNLISSPLGGSTKAVIRGSTEQKIRRVEIMWAVGTILNDLNITFSNDEKSNSSAQGRTHEPRTEARFEVRRVTTAPPRLLSAAVYNTKVYLVGLCIVVRCCKRCRAAGRDRIGMKLGSMLCMMIPNHCAKFQVSSPQNL